MKEKNILPYTGWFIVLVIFIFSFSKNALCKDGNIAHNSSGGSPIIEREKIFQGFTLITPLYGGGNKNPIKRIYLTDLYGKPAHTWETQYAPFYALLKKNGNLVVSEVVPDDPNKYPSPGRTGIIQELDWNGKVVWEYRNNYLTHDFEVMPNGNVAVTVWERVPKAIGTRVKGGVVGTEFDGDIWADKIIEIDKNGKIVWEWHAFEHLDPAIDVLEPLAFRAEWTHINSLQYLDRDPFTQEPAILMSIRHTSTIVIVKKSTGEILWRSPKSIVNMQHDASMLENGHILVFDNGPYRIPNPLPLLGSKVLEIDPQTNKVTWEFANGNNSLEKAEFESSIISGAQRLKNGNTLIIDGLHGHLFEITKEKQLVWDMINPFSAATSGLWPNIAIFKSRRYSPTDIDWPQNLGSSLPMKLISCTK